MKNIFLILILSTLIATAWAAAVDSSFESRIVSACVKSVEEGGKQIPNYRAVCKCIGETHLKSANEEPKQKDALQHIEWTAKFYETTDMKVLQRMVDKNPALSSFDDQVVDDCISSSNLGARK